MDRPQVSFLSLFVPDLKTASLDYQKVFAVEPEVDPTEIIGEHPCSPLPPVVFRLGNISLALYQQDGRTTHAGDVGIGVITKEPLTDVVARVQAVAGQTFVGPGPLPQGDQLAVFMLRDRHFFEVLGLENPGRPDDSSDHIPEQKDKR